MEGPYFFVSYAPADEEVVLPELTKLGQQGALFWRDQRTDRSIQWPPEVEQSINRAVCVLFYVSSRSIVASTCRQEIAYALSRHKPLICVHLEDAPIQKLNPGLAYELERKRVIEKHRLPAEHYDQILVGALREHAPLTPQKVLPQKVLPKPKTGVQPQQVVPNLAIRQRRQSSWVFIFFLFLVILYGGSYLVLSRFDPSREKDFSSSATTLDVLSNLPTIPPMVPKADEECQNWLGMIFLPAGTPGILVSKYDTRVQDFRAYEEEVHDFSSQAPSFPQTPDSPAVNVSWEEANRFCLWLTRKEHQLGIIGENQSYRLPLDSEWTAAAASATTFPWGDTWPPPPNFGNYHVPGSDSFPNTSPVGSFPPNKFGLCDMSGNVWQMCEDKSDQKGAKSVLYIVRGGSWNTDDDTSLKSNYRGAINPHKADDKVGFRCVLVTH